MSLVSGGNYQILTEQNIEQIHNRTLQIFEEVGIEIASNRALKLFESNGASVDWDKKIVRASGDWVMEKLSTVPESITLYGRDPKYDLELKGTNVYMGTGGTALNVIDPYTGEKRLSKFNDMLDAARLTQYLDNIDFFVISLYPNEFSKENVDINRFLASLRSTEKHIMGGIYDSKGAMDVIRMAEIVAGGAEELRKRPFISMITCVMSPLKLDNYYTELMIEIAERGIPVATPTEPMSGATAPVTLAGTLVQLNAETLAAIILTQLVNAGTPVLYGSVSTVMNPRTGGYLSGAVESGLLNGGAAQLAQYYSIPYYATAGMSDSKLPDAQAGYEKALTLTLAALSGANYIHDAAGLLEFAMTVSYEQMVIDNEIIGMVVRALKGIEVNDDTMAMDIIKRVNSRGNYIAEPHTVKHLRTEIYDSKVADRSTRDEWEKKGSFDTAKRARSIAIDILENTESDRLSDSMLITLKKHFPDLNIEKQ